MKRNSCFTLLLVALFFRLQSADQTVLPDIKFWLVQFKEHAEFASDFTKDPKLKQKGLNLSQNIGELIVRPNKNIQNDFIKLCDTMKSYQNEVASNLKKTDKSNKLQLALLDHMNKETDYAKQKAEGKKFTKEDEARFWSIEHKGQAEVMAKLMNENVPAAKNLSIEAESIVKNLDNNVGYFKSSKLTTVETANKELNAIGKQLDMNPQETRIPAKLAKHEERERKYAEQIFRKFGTK